MIEFGKHITLKSVKTSIVSIDHMNRMRNYSRRGWKNSVKDASVKYNNVHTLTKEEREWLDVELISDYELEW